MSVTPPIAGFFGLDPRFLSAPAANSSLINSLLYGSSFQMLPINITGFYSGIPPIFGGPGFTGFPTTAFNMFTQPSVMLSPFSGGGAFGNGFGTAQFGVNQATNGLFSNQAINPFAGGLPLGIPTTGFGMQTVNPFSLTGFNTAAQNPFGFVSFI